MGQILHKCARTTEAIRKEIQDSKEGIMSLAKKYGINHKTVIKWKKRDFVHDAKMGPKDPHSTVLTREEEAACVAFRKHTLLSLDDCLYALKESIPHLSRSSLHRLFQRHGISRLPESEEKKPRRAKFKEYSIGYIHIDITEVRTEEGKIYLFVAIDRTSKFVVAKLFNSMKQLDAADFLLHVLERIPYKIHTILTDNGIQFTNISQKSKPTAFDIICKKNGIEHRLTQPAHPWTNGQVERMNKTIKEATVWKYHYVSHDELEKHLQTFVDAYNFARKLKTLNGLTPYEFIIKQWKNNPKLFRMSPLSLFPGLDS